MVFIRNSFLVLCCFSISIMSTGLPVIPGLDKGWWGPENTGFENDTSIKPFHIKFDSKMIEDLRYRLRNHRPFTPLLQGVGFDYGFNSDSLHSWADYWANDYDFKKQEHILNQFPQYKTCIQGLWIHFVWVKPQVPANITVIPLLLLHGFPGSVVEFYKAMPWLTASSNNRDFAVEVIAPSLPGFGFSDGAVRPGLGGVDMAVVLRNLMQRLGFKKFYVQGGDWGSFVGLSMATLYPQEVLGYHTNLALSLSKKSLYLWVFGSVEPSLVVDDAVKDRLYPITEKISFILREFGYFHIQATKPDTVEIAMSDSPVGLLAYILQIFSSGSRKQFVYETDGGLDDLYSRDKLLNNLMFYWVPNSFTTASRIYAEAINKRNLTNTIYSIPTSVPTWTVHAKDEFLYLSPVMLRDKYKNLLNSTILDHGGHFLAFEKPESFSQDVLQALTAFIEWHKKN